MKRVFLALMLAAVAAHGARQSSSYGIDPEVLNAGGGGATSSNYGMESSIGTPAGVSTGGLYELSAGYDSDAAATPPAGGSMTVDPSGPVAQGADFEVEFAGWIDDELPLSYRVQIDDSEVSPVGPSPSRLIAAPGSTGSYTLRGWVADANGATTFVERALEVVTDIEAWRYRYFETTLGFGALADDFDFDFDGRVNGIEWALDGDPTRPDSTPLKALAPSGGGFEVEYKRRSAAVAAGYDFSVKWNDGDFSAPWSAAGVSESVIADDGFMQTVRALMPTGSLGRRFARLEVALPAAGP